MEKKNLIPSSVPSFAACDEPFPSVSCRCLPQPCVDPRAAPRIMGPGRTRGRCRCLGWWETNQHAGGSAFLALAAPGSPRFELGECSRCSWPAGLLCSLVPQEPRFFLKLLIDNICIIKLDGFHMKGTEKDWRRHNSVSEDPGS